MSLNKRTVYRFVVGFIVVVVLGTAVWVATSSGNGDGCLSTETIASHMSTEIVERDQPGSTLDYSSKCDYSVLPAFSLSMHISVPKSQRSTWDDWDVLVADARTCEDNCSDYGMDHRNGEGDDFWETPASDYIRTTNVTRYGLTGAPLVSHRVAMLRRDGRTICQVNLTRFSIDEESFPGDIQSVEDIAAEYCS